MQVDCCRMAGSASASHATLCESLAQCLIKQPIISPIASQTGGPQKEKGRAQHGPFQWFKNLFFVRSSANHLMINYLP